MARLVYLANASTLEIDAETCTGCGVCTEVCARGVISIQSRKAQVIDLDACIECGACKMNCAFGAIHVQTGVGCANALINEALSRKSGQQGSCACG